MAAPTGAYRCLSSRGACRMRVSKLGVGGALAPGSGNLYVADAVVSIASTPVVVAGATDQQRNGCNDLVVDWQDDPTINRTTLEGSLATMDAELIALLTGATPITSGGTTVGWQERHGTGWGPDVCVEVWSKAINLDRQDAAAGKLLWWHQVYPLAHFHPGAMTVAAGTTLLPFTGEGLTNPNIGLGAAADWPAVLSSYRNYFLDDAIPAASCGKQALAVAGSS